MGNIFLGSSRVFQELPLGGLNLTRLTSQLLALPKQVGWIRLLASFYIIYIERVCQKVDFHKPGDILTVNLKTTI